MGMYDNVDPDMQNKAGLIMFVFMLVICVIFVVAKIFGVIDWSWWWVACPVWAPFSVGLIMLLCGIKPPGQ